MLGAGRGSALPKTSGALSSHRPLPHVRWSMGSSGPSTWPESQVGAPDPGSDSDGRRPLRPACRLPDGDPPMNGADLEQRFEVGDFAHATGLPGFSGEVRRVRGDRVTI